MILKLLRERSRSQAVRHLNMLATPIEPGLNRFVEQAARAFAAPIALLTILDEQMLLIKASVGLEMACMPRKDSFCNFAVDREDLLEVCDAQLHPVFRKLPAVAGESYIRYYIGAPVTLASKVDVGVLCIVDTVTRSPASRDQRAYLSGLARQAAHAIERRADLADGLAA